MPFPAVLPQEDLRFLLYGVPRGLGKRDDGHQYVHAALRCRGADIDRSEAHGIPGPDEGKEAGRGAETGRREKGSEIGVSSLMLPCRRVFAIDLCL